MDQKLKAILIKTRRQVFTEMVGSNASPFRGEGFDFMELREYQLGDDIRKIDWTITAKLQKPYVKIFHEERELNIAALCLMGGGLFFGTKRLKTELVTEIAAIIGYSAVKNGDRFSGIIATDAGLQRHKPTKRLYGVNRFCESVESFDVLGHTVTMRSLEPKIFSGIKKRSVLFIIGDFLDPASLSLLSKKHEIVAVIVRDRFEEHPHPLGQVQLKDPATGRSVETHFSERSIARYRANLQANDETLFAHLYKNRVRFVKIYTDDEPIAKLARLFGGRL